MKTLKYKDRYQVSLHRRAKTAMLCNSGEWIPTYFLRLTINNPLRKKKQ
jgi:hypothetical protein